VRIVTRIATGLGLLLLAGYIGLIAYAYWPTGIEELPARELARPEDRFARVNGLDLRFRVYGPETADRPNLLLIHGFGNSLQSFRLLAPRLARQFHVITVDLPGFGLSSKPVDYDYSNAGQARTIGDFIRTLGMEKVIVGGHSLGGAIALHIAINEPEVTGLLLFNPGIINTGVPPIAKYLFFPFQRLMAKTFNDREFRQAFIRNSFVNPDIITDEVVDDLMLASRTENFLAAATVMMDFYADPAEAEMLGDVKVPTLIVWGTEDRNKTPEELEALQSGIKDSTVVRVTEAGHYVHEEGAAAAARGIIAAKSLWTK